MDVILQFVRDHYHAIIEFVLLICVLFVTIFKKKVKFVDTLKQQITAWLPGCIDFTEKHCGCLKGEDKLQYCIDFIYTFFVKDYLSREEYEERYVKFIKTQIEAILSTPQKKER